MKKELNMVVHTFDFPENLNIPPQCQDIIFSPCWASDFVHFYYLINFKDKKIVVFEIDLKEEVNIFKEIMKEYKDYPNTPHNMTFNQLIGYVFMAHQGEQGNNLIIVSLIHTNFFIKIDLTSNKAYKIYDENCSNQKVYSSTNQIINNKMYTCRWEFKDMYKRFENPSLKVDLDIIEYDIENDKFNIVETVPCADQIHSVNLTPDNRYLVLVEMNTDPKLPYPKKIEEETVEIKREIYNNGLRDSLCLTYDLHNKKYWINVIPDCPAHIEFDELKDNTFFITLNKLGYNRDNVSSFGAGSIEKYSINENKTTKLGVYGNDPNFIRLAGHRFFRFNNEEKIVVTVHPNQVFMLNASDMTLDKKIKLKENIKKISFSDGALVYPLRIIDKSPFSVNFCENSPYIYLDNVLTIAIYNFVEEKYECEFKFNCGMPIVGEGHSTKFNTNYLMK